MPESSNLKVNLAYGQGCLDVELPAKRTTVIAPSHIAGLADEKAALVQALERRFRAGGDPGDAGFPRIPAT